MSESPIPTTESERLSPDHRKRRAALEPAHARGFDRFLGRLLGFEAEGKLIAGQVEVVIEHLLRLAERGRNPANTGNIEDLFCHTLLDTGDPVRAYAQALADSVKVVPMDPAAPLLPELRNLEGTARFARVGDLEQLGEADRMLVTHTMVAFGDPEMWASAEAFVRVSEPGLDEAGVDRAVARMAVQSQHLPSSSFVMARARGLTVDCLPLWLRAGYDRSSAENAQKFYDVCAEFDPAWTGSFLEGRVPSGAAWDAWRGRYLAYRAHLPEELVYQLSSDTLTNFFDGTLESGKWTDASVAFHGVRDVGGLPVAIARIVNQYIAEHVALHDRPAEEIAEACAEPLRPWGVAFEEGRAVVRSPTPEKLPALTEQLEAALARVGRG